MSSFGFNPYPPQTTRNWRKAAFGLEKSRPYIQDVPGLSPDEAVHNLRTSPRPPRERHRTFTAERANSGADAEMDLCDLFSTLGG